MPNKPFAASRAAQNAAQNQPAADTTTLLGNAQAQTALLQEIASPQQSTPGYNATFAGLAVASGDSLVINAISTSFVQFMISGTYEVVLADGTLQKFPFQFNSPASDYTPEQIGTAQFSESGYLVSVSFSPIVNGVTAVFRGALYVSASLIDANSDFNTLLCAGYNDGSVGPTWTAGGAPYIEPSFSGNGFISDISIGEPSAGSPPGTITPQPFTITKLRSVSFSFVTSAVAGNRMLRLQWKDLLLGVWYAYASTGATVSPSTTVAYSGGIDNENNFFNASAVSTNQTIVTFPLPEVYIFSEGSSTVSEISFTITNIDTNDQVSNQCFQVEQWFNIIP